MRDIKPKNSARIQLYLFGTPKLYIDGERKHFATQHHLGLLAYLAVESDKVHRREILASLFWSETTEARAKQNLRQALYSLRQILGNSSDVLLKISRSTVEFEHNIDVWLDVAKFDEPQESVYENLSAEGLRERIGLYQGDLLDGIHIDEASGFVAWHQRQSTRHYLALLKYYDSLLDHLLRTSKIDEARRYAHDLLAYDNTRERTYQYLMRIEAHGNDRDAVIRIYDHCTETLHTRLNVEPSFETHDLLRQLLVTMAGTRNNLPTFSPAFVGRAHELTLLEQQLTNTNTRMVSLIAQGGQGKTRLAVEIAQRCLIHYPDGVFFVAVESLKTADELLASLMNIMKLQPSKTRSPQDIMNDYLRKKQILLIIDNFEHIDSATSLLEKFLQTAPKLQLIVTSRVRLQIPAEHVFSVNGLSLKDAPDTLSDAVTLFVQAAQQADRNLKFSDEDLPVIRKICSQLDGSPLAILLAAAWVHALSIADIAEELEANLDFLSVDHSEIPSRQRSLRIVFEYSWKLLPASERTMLARLALLQGKFTREAALQVGDGQLQWLLSLVKCSLIQFDRMQARYEIHPIIRYFASEKLEGNGELMVTRQAILDFYSNKVSRIVSLELRDQEEAVLKLVPDFANIRQAWLIATTFESTQNVATMVTGFMMLCQTTGRYVEGQNLLDVALRNTVSHDDLWFRLAGYLGELHTLTGNFDAARACLNIYLNYVSQSSEDDYLLSQAHLWLGILEMSCGNYADAWEHHTFAQTIFMEGGLAAPRLQIQLALEMGRTAQLQSRYDESDALYQQSLKLSLATDYKSGAQRSLNNMGANALRQGKLTVAEAHFEECLHYGRTALTLCNLGITAFMRKNVAKGVEALKEGCQLLRDSGQQQPLAQNLYNLSEGYYQLGQFEEAMTYAQESLSVRQQLNDPRGLAMGLFGVGKIHMILDEYGQAEHLFDEALSLVQGESDAMVAGFIHLGSAMNAFLQSNIETMQAHLHGCEMQFTRIQKQSALVDVSLLRALAFLKDGAMPEATNQLLDLLADYEDKQSPSSDMLTVCATVLHHAGKSDCVLDILSYLQHNLSRDPFYREKLLRPIIKQLSPISSSNSNSATINLAQIQTCLDSVANPT